MPCQRSDQILFEIQMEINAEDKQKEERSAHIQKNTWPKKYKHLSVGTCPNCEKQLDWYDSSWYCPYCSYTFLV